MQSQKSSSPIGTDRETYPFLATQAEKVIPFCSNLPCSNLIYSYWHSQSHWLPAGAVLKACRACAEVMNAGHVGDKPFTFWHSPQRRSPKEFKAIFLWWEIGTCSFVTLCHLSSCHLQSPRLLCSLLDRPMVPTLTDTAKSFSGSKTLI